MEIWVKIKNWPYEVSDLGNIRNVNGRQLNPSINGQGRRLVTLHNKGRRKSVHVYKLVAGAFLGKSALPVCHKNGVRTDDRLENLKLASHKENTNDRIEHGTMFYGERVHNAKLTNSQVVQIKSRYKFRCKTNGTMAIAREFKVAPSTISAVMSGQNWKTIQAIAYERENKVITTRNLRP